MKKAVAINGRLEWNENNAKPVEYVLEVILRFKFIFLIIGILMEAYLLNSYSTRVFVWRRRVLRVQHVNMISIIRMGNSNFSNQYSTVYLKNLIF